MDTIFYKTALNKSLSSITAQLKINSKIEKTYQAILSKELSIKYEKVKLIKMLNTFSYIPEAKGKEFGVKNLHDTTRTSIDFIVGKTHAIEIKVLKLPRDKHNSPSQCLYDIGQIASDIQRIRNSKYINTLDVVLLIHGNLMKSVITEKELIRVLHNQMYLDYTTYYNFYHKAEIKKDYWKRNMRLQQNSAHKLIGINLPYHRGSPINQSKVFISKNLAVVVLRINKNKVLKLK